MNTVKTKRLFTVLFAGTALAFSLNGLQSCSKKSGASKSSKTNIPSETAVKETPPPPPPPPVEEKEGMQIKRDAAGNYVIQLLLKDLQPVKLMKPAKEGYVVWLVTEANETTNIGNIEGANTWTDKKDRSTFEATSPVKPFKLFITAETNLKAEKPGTQVVWSTRNF